MTYNQLIKHFKTQTAAAAALDVTQPTIANWKSRGKIPPLQQLRLELATGGALNADRKIKPSSSPKVSRQ